MLNRMCRALPCSQPALRTVHHIPIANTGCDPLAPKSLATTEDGARRPRTFPPPMMSPPVSTVISSMAA